MTDAITRAKVRELETRVERLEEQMETARSLLAQQIKLNLERPHT